MEKEVNGPDVEKQFEDLGVLVTIPEQDDQKSLVISDSLPYPFLVNKSPEPDGFDLIRPVINFKVTEEDAEGPMRCQFAPRMKVEVELTKYDFGHLGGEQELKLAYWDESKSKWVLFPAGENCEEGNENCVEIDAENYLATVWISEWSDATMGVGR